MKSAADGACLVFQGLAVGAMEPGGEGCQENPENKPGSWRRDGLQRWNFKTL